LLAGFGAAYLLKNNRAVLIDLSCWTLVPIPLVLFLIYWRSYFFAIRQLLFVTPAIIILAACGVERLLCVYREKAWALPAVYALACLAVIGLHYPDRRPDLRAVGGYLKHTVGQGDAVVAPNSLGLLSYYFPDIYSYGRELSSVGPNSNCRRLFLIEAPYAGAVSQSQLWSIEKRMALQSRLSYRGMDVYVFVSKALK